MGYHSFYGGRKGASFILSGKFKPSALVKLFKYNLKFPTWILSGKRRRKCSKWIWFVS